METDGEKESDEEGELTPGSIQYSTAITCSSITIVEFCALLPLVPGATPSAGCMKSCLTNLQRVPGRSQSMGTMYHKCPKHICQRNISKRVDLYDHVVRPHFITGASLYGQ